MPEFRRAKAYVAGWKWGELSTSQVPPWMNYLYPLAIVGVVVLLVIAYLGDETPVRSAGTGPPVGAGPSLETVDVVDAATGIPVAVPAEAVSAIRAGVLALFTGDASDVPLVAGASLPRPLAPQPWAAVVSEELVSAGPTSVVLSVVVAPEGPTGSAAPRSITGRAESSEGVWQFAL